MKEIAVVEAIIELPEEVGNSHLSFTFTNFSVDGAGVYINQMSQSSGLRQ